MTFGAQDQNAKLVDLLIKRGAEVDALDCSGDTPLWRAAMDYRGDKSTIEVLLKHGADPDKKNRHGISPREIAIESIKPGLKEFFSS
jgi:ankyrin repeat protein